LAPRWVSVTLTVGLICAPFVLVTSATPASAAAHRTLLFSGYTWSVKSSAGRVGPGPNYFSKKNAWVDSLGRLHLAITKVRRHWVVGEVVNTRSLGSGTYTWVLDSRVDNLDPNMVLGLFTYDSLSSAFNNREIDIEASRWGNASDPTDAQFVVQPYAADGNLTRITQGPWVPATFSFSWTATGLSFSAQGASPASWTYAGPNRPPAGGEQADMNFWLNGGHAPKDGQGAAVIVQSFTFTPG
jgi:hypothetical protein